MKNNQYKVIKNVYNNYYEYCVVDMDDENDVPICYTTTKEDANLIAKALNKEME